MNRLAVLLGLSLVAILAASLMTSCGGGGGGGEVTVKGTDYRFDPSDVTVKANQKVKVTLQNNGSLAHNWTVLGMDTVTTGDVNPGQKKSVEFTPTTAGKYTVECTVPGHVEAGMKGTLTVQ